MSALDAQIDGNHYKKLRIQPIELAYLVGGTPCFCKLAKYGSREKVDRSIDLQKALHCVRLEKEMYAKYPALHSQNYPAKSLAELNNASAWIDVFTEDLHLRDALKAMLQGYYSAAETCVSHMIVKSNEQKSTEL